MTRSLCLLTIAALGCGCTQLALFSLGGPKFVEASAKNPVGDIMCAWEPADGQGLEGLPCRGFAGQLMFFTIGHAQPAKVSGDVSIYVFDNQGSVTDQSEPLHIFNFNDVSWNAFLRESNLGAAYQVFIPYTRTGTHEANCTLRVKFTPKDGGQPVYSRMANITLPGRRTGRPAYMQPEGNSVPSTLGASTRTESASPLDLPGAMTMQFRQQLTQLHSAAAASARQIDEPAGLPETAATALPITSTVANDDSDAPRPRGYRLSRE